MQQLPLVQPSTNLVQLWGSIRQILLADFPDQQKFLGGINATSDQEADLVLTVSSSDDASWLNGKPLERICQLLPRNGNSPTVVIRHCNEPATETKSLRNGLASHFTFENFVAGSSNEIALASALKLANDPDKDEVAKISPLYIHGSVGLGKTHLAHAIGNSFLRTNPAANIRILSGEQFMREVQRDFIGERIEAFRSRFRKLDLLILDDIQLVGRDSEQTHKQFVALFNYMTEQGLPMVITSDRPAFHLRKELPLRFVSRLTMGMAVTVGPPDLETRFGILKRHAVRMGFSLPNETARLMAKELRSNCRELLGALRKVLNIASFRHTMPNIEIARQVLDELAIAPLQVSPELILKTVSDFYQLRQRDLLSKRRTQTIANARHVAMYLCRELTQQSLPFIGDLFSRHHTSVLHACRRVETNLAQKGELTQVLTALRQQLGA